MGELSDYVIKVNAIGKAPVEEKTSRLIRISGLSADNDHCCIIAEVSNLAYLQKTNYSAAATDGWLNIIFSVRPATFLAACSITLTLQIVHFCPSLSRRTCTCG